MFLCGLYMFVQLLINKEFFLQNVMLIDKQLASPPRGRSTIISQQRPAFGFYNFCFPVKFFSYLNTIIVLLLKMDLQSQIKFDSRILPSLTKYKSYARCNGDLHQVGFFSTQNFFPLKNNFQWICDWFNSPSI